MDDVRQVDPSEEREGHVELTASRFTKGPNEEDQDTIWPVRASTMPGTFTGSRERGFYPHQECIVLHEQK